MSVLAFVLAVVFALVLLFVAVAAARRGRVTRGSSNVDGTAWYSDGGASFSASSGADCSAGGDGGSSCDGGGGGH